MKKTNTGKIGYETTFITSPDYSEESLKTFIEKCKGIIEAHGGEIVAKEDWGRRKLAYPINKETRGHYTYLLFFGNNSLVAELERNLRINEKVIRFMSVKLGSDFEPATYKRTITPISPPVEKPAYPSAAGQH